jgi:hypothetical protein
VSDDARRIFRLDAHEFAWVIVGSLAFAAVFFYPILCEISYLGPGLHGWLAAGPHFSNLTQLPINNDSDLFAQLRWVPYYTLTHYHQWPFWNPYKCGGMSMLGNPETGIVTPFLLIYLVGGLLAGIFLEIYLHIAIAFIGGYVLGRELGLRPVACIVLAGMFPSSSWLPLHIAFGHLNFLSAAYLPWIIAMLLAACRLGQAFPAAIGGIFCALTLTEGNYTFLYAVMLVAIVATTLAVITLSVRPLIMAALVGVIAFAFGALKFIPLEEWLRIHPRPEFGASFLTWTGAIISLFSRNQDAYRLSPSVWYMVEYGGYLGAPFVALALVGIVGGPRRALPFVLGVLFFFLLFMGDTGPHALITYVREFPLGKNIGICGRWVIPLVFCVGVLAALGAQFVCDHWGRWGLRTAAVLLSVGLIDAWIVGSPNYRYLFHFEFERPRRSESFRQFWVETPIFMTYIAQANMGSVNCQGFGYNVPSNSVLGYNQKGYPGEYFMSDGTVEQTEWTPNRLSFGVSATGPTILVINQNFDIDWHLESGNGTMASDHGRLAVKVPAGNQRLTLFYRPRHIVLAFLMTLGGLIAFVLLWWWEHSPAAARSVSSERSDTRRASAG